MADKINKNSAPAKRRPLTDAQIDKGIAEMVIRHVGILSEHLDSVQIMGTRVKPDGSTQAYVFGAGNQYARMQIAEEYLSSCQ